MPCSWPNAVSYTHLDVYKRQELDKVFASHSFDAVIHFAGYKAVGESVEKPLEYYRNNLDSTLTCLLYTSRCV